MNKSMPGIDERLPVEPWRKALVHANATLQDVIRNLDETGLQIAMVVSDDGVLAGTITDGDIRRGLLRGLTIGSSLTSVIRREPLVVPPDLSRDTALQLMRANVFSAIPVVDAQRRVVGLHLLNKLIAPGLRSNMMVIMAGGQGVRLRPFTNHRPKPLVPVGGKPMLEHIIERARAEGFHRFVFAVHYLGDMIEDYFGDGSRWQVHIEYVRERTPLGTAGAIGLLDPKPECAFVVSNCDVLTDIRYAELLDFHLRHGAAATMAVRLHEWQNPFGVVLTNGVDIIGFEEKPIARAHINAGVYVLEPTALVALPHDEHCHMPALFTRLQESGARTIVYPMHEPWLDVGRVEDLEGAQASHTPRV